MVTRSIADRDAADARRLDVAMTGIPKSELANAVKKLHQDRVVSFIAGIFEIVSRNTNRPALPACRADRWIGRWAAVVGSCQTRS